MSVVHLIRRYNEKQPRGENGGTKYIYDRRRKTPCKAVKVNVSKVLCHVLPPVLPFSFKKQAPVKVCEAAVKVTVKVN